MVAAIIVLSVLLFVSVVFNILLCVGQGVAYEKAELCDAYKQLVKMEECMWRYMEKKLED